MQRDVGGRRIRVAERGQGERGYAIALVSVLLIPLLGFMALAIDVGAWYTEATSVQRAADASALAGVVWMPDIDRARDVVLESIAKNLDTDEQVEIDGVLEDRYVFEAKPSAANPFHLQVIVTDRSAPLYFGQLFVDRVDISRQAIAEFVKPIKLGSPLNSFGNNLPDGCRDPNDSGCETPGIAQPGFWPLLAGRSTNSSYGDAHGSDCGLTDAHCDNANFGNPDYRDTGYLYAIDVPQAAVGDEISLMGYDLSHNANGSGAGKLDNTTGGEYMPTELQVFAADGSLLTTPLNNLLSTGDQTSVNDCSQVIAPEQYPYLTWTEHCSFIATKADVYPIRIRTSGFPGDNQNGKVWNYYAMRAENKSGGPDPRFYALNDMAVKSTTQSGVTPVFHLAEITSTYAGADLLIRLWDAGDANRAQELTLEILTPWGQADTCAFRSYERLQTPSAFEVSGTAGDPTDNCSIITSEGTTMSTPAPLYRRFDNKWLEVRVPVPDSNDCELTPQGCWWYVRYIVDNVDGASRGVVDVTTWEASVIGDPVRLVS